MSYAKVGKFAKHAGQEKDKYDDEPDAEWLFDRVCPQCEGGGMLARDKFGIFCAVNGCNFQEPK